jgi:hypothetical protein
MIYAQIDAHGQCFAVSQLTGEVKKTSLVKIDTFDETLLGQIWDGKKWTAPLKPEPLA